MMICKCRLEISLCEVSCDDAAGRVKAHLCNYLHGLLLHAVNCGDTELRFSQSLSLLFLQLYLSLDDVFHSNVF